MKTTLEISDLLFRKVKATAAHRGQTLKQFVTDALQEKLGHGPSARAGADPAWVHHFGAFGKTAQMRAETRRIQKAIDQEFESLDPEMRSAGS